MSEKSRHTPPNVRIIAKNNQIWSVDWADDPNEYCRSFNSRARELNLGLVATTHFPKGRRWNRLWVVCGILGLLGLTAYVVKLWLFSPFWIFHNHRHEMVFRYRTRIHAWCEAPPTHYIHFREKPKVEVKVGRLIRPVYDENSTVRGFGHGVDDYGVDYPIEKFQQLRADPSQPTQSHY